MKFPLTIGQQYQVMAPLTDDRCGDKKLHKGSLWICKFTYHLTKVFNDGTCELQSSSNKEAKPFIVDARRLRGF